MFSSSSSQFLLQRGNTLVLFFIILFRCGYVVVSRMFASSCVYFCLKLLCWDYLMWYLLLLMDYWSVSWWFHTHYSNFAMLVLKLSVNSASNGSFHHFMFWKLYFDTSLNSLLKVTPMVSIYCKSSSPFLSLPVPFFDACLVM